jgi:hypothetical protein
MSVNAIKDELHRRLGELLVPEGYKFKKLENDVEGFMRHVDGIRQMLFIGLWDRGLAYEFTLGVGIRVDAVEAIYHLYSEYLPEYQASSDTCVINLKALVPGLDRLTVYDAATIQQAVHQLAPYITNQILPFLDSHRDVRSLDRLLNQGKPAEQVCGVDGRGSWVLSFAMSAVILARLAGNPDFDKLVERYRSEIRDFDDDDQQRYDRLVGYLRSLP